MVKDANVEFRYQRVLLLRIFSQREETSGRGGGGEVFLLVVF